MRRTNKRKAVRELRRLQGEYEYEWKEQITSSAPNAERLQALHEKLLNVELDLMCLQEPSGSRPDKRVEAAARRGISVYDPDADDLNPSTEPSYSATSATSDVNIDSQLSAQAGPTLAPREQAAPVTIINPPVTHGTAPLAADGVGAPDSCPPPAPPEHITVDAVLRLAERGFRLLPVKQRDKTPLIKDWPSKATADAASIREWSQQYPACNWGLACGPASGVWVLDVDGDKGKASLRALIDQYGRLPTTLIARTGKGGHCYWLYPQQSTIRNSAGTIAEGLDVRGAGGYVVIPPSIHPSGRPYEWVDSTAAVVEAPEWLLNMVFAPAQRPMTISTGSTTQVIAESSTNITTQVIAEGRRNAELTSLAGTMRKRGMTPEAIEAALMAENANRCRPPLPEAEVRAIAQSISRYEPQPKALSTVRRADLLTLADVESKEVEWLWRPYLPAGMLAMLSGDPAAGKTFLALAMAAALTTGRVPYPSEPCDPIHVLYLSVENDPACVVRPRFDALGGDAGRLHLVRGALAGDGADAKPGGICLSDVSVLGDALDRTHARLLIVDPIQSYLGPIDAHRANETRPVLDGLTRLAEEHKCCVLLLRHLSKAPSGRAIHRGLGSIDLTGAVRTEMLAGNPPNDPQQRALVQIKNNLGAYGTALGYAIDASGQFFWTGESTLNQSDLLAAEGADQDSAKDEAAQFLREQLADGPRPTADVQTAARARGISWRTVERAKKGVGVTSRPDGFERPWVLELQSPPNPSTVRQVSVLADSAELGGLCEVDQRERGEL